MASKGLEEFGCTIVDEAHKRTCELDLLLGLLKKVQRRRKDLKVCQPSHIALRSKNCITYRFSNS